MDLIFPGKQKRVRLIRPSCLFLFIWALRGWSVVPPLFEGISMLVGSIRCAANSLSDSGNVQLPLDQSLCNILICKIYLEHKQKSNDIVGYRLFHVSLIWNLKNLSLPFFEKRSYSRFSRKFWLLFPKVSGATLWLWSQVWAPLSVPCDSPGCWLPSQRGRL